MYYDIFGHVLYSLRNAEVKQWPFPHFYARQVFPQEFYEYMMEKLAQKSDFSAGARNYEGRKFASAEDFSDLSFMNSHEFLVEVARIFKPWMKLRFNGESRDFFHDLRLIRDPKGYQIGPHTDAVWKVVSLLFYLPAYATHINNGTSIYLPKDRSFHCQGGPHHNPENFDKIYTANYFPNTCFGFFKTDYSFHGVEPLEEEFNRDLLLYNIYDSDLYKQIHKTKIEPS